MIDSHCHIQADAFDEDRAAVLAAAQTAGVARILVPGWDLESSRAAIQLARAHGLDAGVGIHPHVAAGADDATWDQIVALADEPEVVAIGETGLDYDRGFSPRVAQLVNLRRHLLLGPSRGQAGDPALPLEAGRARRAGRSTARAGRRRRRHDRLAGRARSSAGAASLIFGPN